MSNETAITLLVRHARGEDLGREDRDTMLVGLFDFWRRDRIARKWANVKEGTDVLDCRVHTASSTTIGDIVHDLLVDVMTRKWPSNSDLDGISNAYLAGTLGQRLFHAYTRGKRFSEKHSQLPDDNDSPAIEPDESHLGSFAGSAEVDSGPPKVSPRASTPLSEENLASEPMPPATPGDELAFAMRCHHAAPRFLESQRDDAMLPRIIEAYLAPLYLDDEKVTGKEVAKRFDLSEATLTRHLQRYGIRLPRTKDADSHDLVSVKQVWLTTPVGTYLFKECGVTNTEQMALALKTLCACNYYRLEALIAEAPTAGK